MNRTLEFIRPWLRGVRPATITWVSTLRKTSHAFQRGSIPWGRMLTLTLVTLALAACSGNSATSTPQITRYPIPTSHGLFSESVGMINTETNSQLTTTPTVANFFMEHQTATPELTKTPTPTSPPSINEFPLTGTYSQTLYADSFNPNWSVERDNRVDVTIRSSEVPREGKYSISITPKERLRPVYIVVSQDSTEVYLRDQVLGFRFWINSGNDYLEPDDLAVTVLGSNEFPYYVEGDHSVTSDYDPVFSETQLYFLGFSRSVPPYTWAEVIVWLDDLIYDPIYEYVVGFYLKNGENFMQSYYLDDIQVILTDPELPARIP